MVTPDTPLDPVAGFLSGVSSVFVRTLIGAAAILAGCGLALLCSGWGSDQAIVWFLLFPGAIFMWGTLGAWFFVGLLAAVAAVFSLLAFVREWRPRLALFLTFTGAVVYFAPVTFSASHWLWLLGSYSVVSACYWLFAIVTRDATI